MDSHHFIHTTELLYNNIIASDLSFTPCSSSHQIPPYFPVNWKRKNFCLKGVQRFIISCFPLEYICKMNVEKVTSQSVLYFGCNFPISKTHNIYI